MSLFLPRNAMRKRGLCCRPVSVRPYVCHVGALYPHSEDNVKHLGRPGSPIVVVFWT